MNTPINTDEPTLVTFVLDQTGSMQRIKAATIQGFNEYVGSLARLPDTPITFSLYLFNTLAVEHRYNGVAIGEVAPLGENTYQPREGTPLYDAAVDAIKATEELTVSYAKQHGKAPSRIVIVIQTDGQDNSSKRHTRIDLQDLITRRIKEGWEFLYLGADIDCYGVAQSYGIPVANTVSYQGHNTAEMFAATAHNTALYASGKSVSMGYSAQQKAAVGDPAAGNLAAGNLYGIGTAIPQGTVISAPLAVPNLLTGTPTPVFGNSPLTDRNIFDPVAEGVRQQQAMEQLARFRALNALDRKAIMAAKRKADDQS